jgi:peptidoglycan lytic transglycosylase
VRRAVRRAALALAVCALAPAPARSLGVPVPSADPDQAVRWSPPPARPPARAALGARLRAARDPADSLAAWGTVVSDTLLRPYALRRVAALELARGDTAGADLGWAALSRERSPWQWEALRARSDLASARGQIARADSLLERAERRDWPEAERAEWLARRVDLRLTLGDTAAAMTFAGQMIARYPATPGVAEALRILEDVHAARGEALSWRDDSLAAEVDRLRGRRESAVVRLARWTPSGAPVSSRLVWIARLQREMGHFAEARVSSRAARSASRSARDSLESWLEEARTLREEGQGTTTLDAYGEALRLSPDGAADAGWERARFLEQRGEWASALADYARVAEGDGDRRDAAALRAGLMCIADGAPAAALGWLERGDSEAARFWHGVVLRRTGRAGGDSILRVLAARPGYTFYRCAARETLGVRGWPGAPARVPAARAEPGVRLAIALDELGCHDDASQVLDRWAARDARLARPGAPSGGRPAGAWLDAAAAAYGAGRPRQAIRFAARAVGPIAQGPDSLAWAVSPWLYPPAYDSSFAAWPERAALGGLDRPLLQAVAWKESGFDPGARSRSDAFGLLQLKRAAVTDVAGWLRERPPSDSALADPALNLRYGARYLQRMLERFGGDLPLALAAYNAGPTVAKRWTRLRAMGGDALACEEIDYPETQDYVKSILAVRQAYRELRPTTTP